MVRVKAHNGQYVLCRVLLDSGSENSFVTFRCAAKLGLKQRSHQLQLGGIGNSTKRHNSAIVNFQAECQHTKGKVNVRAFILPEIACPTPSATFQSLNSLPDIARPLADVNFSKSRAIGILLGSDVYEAIVMSGKVKHDS